MEIQNFLSNLPQSIVKGEKIFLPDQFIHKIFRFAQLNYDDVFYDLGCGISNAIIIASKNYGVKKSIGVDIDLSICEELKDKISKNNVNNIDVINDNILNINLNDATVVFFWFTEEHIVNQMIEKFKEMMDGSKIISIWSPPGMLLPSKIDFPFFICEKPFKFASSLPEQIKSIYGNSCIDFTASWLLVEKYLDALEIPGDYKRFINILQSMVFWINAWNADVSCEKDIPPPVDAYLGILKTFFNIDLSNLLQK